MTRKPIITPEQAKQLELAFIKATQQMVRGMEQFAEAVAKSQKNNLPHDPQIRKDKRKW